MTSSYDRLIDLASRMPLNPNASATIDNIHDMLCDPDAPIRFYDHDDMIDNYTDAELAQLLADETIYLDTYILD
jgi:hypothetical protein